MRAGQRTRLKWLVFAQKNTPWSHQELMIYSWYFVIDESISMMGKCL
jgi:hypothetical protein